MTNMATSSRLLSMLKIVYVIVMHFSCFECKACLIKYSMKGNCVYVYNSNKVNKPDLGSICFQSTRKQKVVLKHPPN